MTSPRTRRLTADAQRLHDAFTGHPAVHVEALGPAPAERYRVVYGVPGLRLTPDHHVARAYQHVVEVYLGAGYPREKPYVVSQTPVFHPNFGSHVCIADHWTPSQSLVDVVVQMGEMLQWQAFNTRSPLNAVAARWAAENTHQLPVGATSVQPLADVAVRLEAPTVVVPAQPVGRLDEPDSWPGAAPAVVVDAEASYAAGAPVAAPGQPFVPSLPAAAPASFPAAVPPPVAAPVPVAAAPALVTGPVAAPVAPPTPVAVEAGVAATPPQWPAPARPEPPAPTEARSTLLELAALLAVPAVPAAQAGPGLAEPPVWEQSSDEPTTPELPEPLVAPPAVAKHEPAPPPPPPPVPASMPAAFSILPTF